MPETIVDPELVAAVWPVAHPGEDPVLYGHVDLQPKGAFEARSLQTFRLVYTVGRYGLDDTGSIRIVFRFVGDAGSPQTTDPAGYDYVTAHTSTGARIALHYSGTGHQRPWAAAAYTRCRRSLTLRSASTRWNWSGRAGDRSWRARRAWRSA